MAQPSDIILQTRADYKPIESQALSYSTSMLAKQGIEQLQAQAERRRKNTEMLAQINTETLPPAIRKDIQSDIDKLDSRVLNGDIDPDSYEFQKEISSIKTRYAMSKEHWTKNKAVIQNIISNPDKFVTPVPGDKGVYVDRSEELIGQIYKTYMDEDGFGGRTLTDALTEIDFGLSSFSQVNLDFNSISRDIRDYTKDYMQKMFVESGQKGAFDIKTFSQSLTKEQRDGLASSIKMQYAGQVRDALLKSKGSVSDDDVDKYIQSIIPTELKQEEAVSSTAYESALRVSEYKQKKKIDAEYPDVEDGGKKGKGPKIKIATAGMFANGREGFGDQTVIITHVGDISMPLNYNFEGAEYFDETAKIRSIALYEDGKTALVKAYVTQVDSQGNTFPVEVVQELPVNSGPWHAIDTKSKGALSNLLSKNKMKGGNYVWQKAGTTTTTPTPTDKKPKSLTE